jgi:hypothetical protein
MVGRDFFDKRHKESSWHGLDIEEKRTPAVENRRKVEQST